MDNLKELVILPFSHAQMKQILAAKIDQAGVSFQVATRLAGNLIDSGFGPCPQQVYRVVQDGEVVLLEYPETIIKISGNTYKKTTRQ